MYNGWTPNPKRILTEAQEQAILQRESNCAVRAAEANHACRKAYKSQRSPGEHIALCIRNHEENCPTCQAEIAPIAPIAPIVAIDTPRCICGAMLAQVRGRQVCTIHPGLAESEGMTGVHPNLILEV